MTQADTPATALAACPFCGGRAFSYFKGAMGWAQCVEENACRVHPAVCADTEAEAITAWNTRTPSPAEPVALDAVRASVINGKLALGNWQKYNRDPADEVVYQAEKVASALTSLLAALADREAPAAMVALDAGYKAAWQEIADLLDIPAQPISPRRVHEEQVMPMLRAALRRPETTASDDVVEAEQGDAPDEITGLKAEIERQEGLARTYRQAQLTAEEKLCRSEANAAGWEKRAGLLESKLAAALADREAPAAMVEDDDRAQMLQDFMEQHYGLCLWASEWDAIVHFLDNNPPPAALRLAERDHMAPAPGEVDCAGPEWDAIAADALLAQVKGREG